MFKEAVLRAFGPINQIFILISLCILASLLTSMLGVSLLAKMYGIDLLSDFDVLARYEEPFVVAANKLMLVMQHLGLFIFPALIFNRLFTFKEQGSFIFGQDKFQAKWIGLAMLTMLAGIPLVNAMLEVNSMFVLGDSADVLEETAARFTEYIVAADGIGVLLLNVLIIAVMPALGEEFIFRGVLQKIFARMAKNIHVGIIVSAFFFSALHLQFYGFIPRFALGVLFGYIAVWGGSIWYAVIAHAVNNGFSLVIAYLIQHGMLDEAAETFGATTSDWIFLGVGTVLLAILIRYWHKNSLFSQFKDVYMTRPKTLIQLLKDQQEENQQDWTERSEEEEERRIED